MNRLRLLFLFLVAVALATASCKKEDPEPQPCCGKTNSVQGTKMTEERPPFNPSYFTLSPPEYFPPFPRTKRLSREAVELGRKLFYEERLSGDNSQSCGSCHNQKWNFTDNGKSFSVGIDGKAGAINSMPIMNLAWTNSFFWDGRSPSLEDQAIEPILNPIEMHSTWAVGLAKLKRDRYYVDQFWKAFGTDDWDSTHAADAIAQFEMTLISSNSTYDEAVAKIKNDPRIEPPLGNASVQRGFRIFTTEPSPNGGGGDCFHCHSHDNLLFTNNQFMNNGLDEVPGQGLASVTGKSTDIGKFKTPSLRNVAESAPYMHDGRFATLEEVVEFYNSGIKGNSPNLAPIMKEDGLSNGLNLTAQQKADLVAFLKALSDRSFYENEEFSDPDQ